MRAGGLTVMTAPLIEIAPSVANSSSAATRMSASTAGNSCANSSVGTTYREELAKIEYLLLVLFAERRDLGRIGHPFCLPFIS